ncbi:hypothetical protein L2E82_25508 [Cichorium intybus]|uniref:Uncharacterized protein n=1 Tax=Cichorium intybus TaxID=13427 RepID=A0ACB9E438_CICIN|nr:hypothetical protein L2E82_25508 [Cichorium intybus]
MDGSQGSYQPNSDGILIDLFVYKKKPYITITTSNAANLKFTDSSTNMVFSIDPPPRSHLHHHQLKSLPPFLNRLRVDSSGKPLISIAHNQDMPIFLFQVLNLNH